MVESALSCIAIQHQLTVISVHKAHKLVNRPVLIVYNMSVLIVEFVLNESGEVDNHSFARVTVILGEISTGFVQVVA